MYPKFEEIGLFTHPWLQNALTWLEVATILEKDPEPTLIY